MDSGELINFVTIHKLINASTTDLLEVSASIENPLLFLEFCKSRNLAAFLYSVYSKGLFEEAFPFSEADFFKLEYKRTWAANLRYDTIGEELTRHLKVNAGIDFIFLDLSLRGRLLYGNKFIRSNKVVQLLVPEKTELESALGIIQSLGFKKFSPDSRIAAKLMRRLNQKSNRHFHKRNEFLVCISPTLPVMLGEHIDSHSLLERKVEVKLAARESSILSEQDELLFSLLSLLDDFLHGFDYSTDLLNSYTLLRDFSLKKEHFLGVENEKLELLVQALASLVTEVLSGQINNQIPELSNHRFFIKDLSYSSGILGMLRRIILYQKISPKIEIEKLYKVIFGLRYI